MLILHENSILRKKKKKKEAKSDLDSISGMVLSSNLKRPVHFFDPIL